MLGFGLNPLVVFSISVISRVRPDVFHLCMMGITKRLLKYLNILCYTASPTKTTQIYTWSGSLLNQFPINMIPY